jgi:hypothetical protein
VDLGLEVLGPAAVAAKPRPPLVRAWKLTLGRTTATRLEVVLLWGSVLLGVGHVIRRSGS